MGVSIIYGAIGSGKSRMCLDDMEKVHNRYPEAKCLMIVPDHYSYEAEKLAVERFGGTGLNNIEVLTFRRMAINTLTSAELNHLTEAGRQMLIYKAVTNACTELEGEEGMDTRLLASMRRRGFLDVAASLISEMKRYLVEYKVLKEKAGETNNNQTLRNKLTAFSDIFEKYTRYVDESGFSDSDEELRVLARHIEEDGGYGSDTYVWVDRFDKMLPQQMCVIEALLKKGVHMTITICYPANGDENEKELYSELKKSYDKITNLAAVYGFEGEREAGEGLSHLKSKPDLHLLLSHFHEDFVYDKKPANIEMFRSRDTYGEVERIACRISDLVRGGKYRYRDMALMCGDENEYIHLIEAIFSEYEIPYFTDRKIILSDHPIAMQILSLFRVLEEDWSYDAVFAYLRSGFVYRKNGHGVFPIDQNEIDSLENFVLRCGIRGGKRWLGDETWRRESGIIDAAFGDETDETADAADKLRREIAAPIEKFAAAVKGKNTATHLASALFEYIEDIGLYGGLKYEIYKFRKKGMVNEAEQFTKIWNLILDVLNQLTAALGDDRLSAEGFAEYISVGLSKSEIRIIPSGIDQLYVGSAERISRSNVKVMFVVGAKNGTFPAVIRTEGFFSDSDRNTMKGELGITIAPDTKLKTKEQSFKVYRALCAVSDKLYLSYSMQDEEGREQSESHLLADIRRKFPKMDVTDNFTSDGEDIVYISSPKATMHRLLVHLSDRYSGRRNILWDYVHDWYKDKEEWQRVLSLISRADYYSRRGVLLDGDAAALLYDGKIKYSASRINAFARCPFEYFLKYGLGVKKREEWQVTPADMGSYAHRVINDFCVAVEEGAEDNAAKITAWRNLTDEKRTEIIENIIEETCTNMLSSGVRDKERTADIFRRMGKTVSQAASLVQKSLAAGNFAQNGMEYAFDTDLSDKVSLKGIVDRVDICEADNGEKYMRIVDYKTGRTEFDVVNIYNGYDMQMVLYALAMREEMRKNGDEPEVAGIYYTGVKSKYEELKTSVTEDNIREVNEKKLRLDGVTFAAEEEEKRLKMLYNMDNRLFENSESVFTDVKIDAKGEVIKVRSLDEINGLMEYARESVIDIDSRARRGDISLNPYDTGGRSGVCDYCDYASVCRFDENERVVREKKGTSDEVWEIMKTKGAAEKGVTGDAEVD